MKSVLTIAGSDPSGGAGIQADLRVFAALGVAGLSAITALTVQNSQGVRSVHPVDADVLGAQIEAVMEDATDLGAVKIGMLGGAAQVRVVAEMLRRFRPPNVVLDPVLASSGGVPLLDEEGRAALLTELMPLCDLVTPNLVEISALTGLPFPEDQAATLEAGKRLSQQIGVPVLVKGGHSPNRREKAADYFIGATGDLLDLYSRPWVHTTNTHGTGCFLASATAVALAQGVPLKHAIGGAKKQLWNGLVEPVVVGKGRGYPDIFAAIRRARFEPTPSPKSVHGLYVLTDSTLRPDRSAEEIVASALAGGAKVIQVREKSMSKPDLVKLCRTLHELTSSAGALLIVNDSVEVAFASGADGVHLGPDDIYPHHARRILGPDRIIGVSVSTVQEANMRGANASYIAVGAIFGSATKSDAGDAIGVDRIREIKAAFPNKPIVAIGGINLGNIDAVIAAGADSAAVISAVVCAPDMEAATRELVSHFPATNRPAPAQEE